jgi:hypothetical protein
MIGKADECSTVHFYFDHKLEHFDKRDNKLVFAQ